MNMLRKFILPGLLAIACTAVGQNYNALYAHQHEEAFHSAGSVL